MLKAFEAFYEVVIIVGIIIAKSSLDRFEVSYNVTIIVVIIIGGSFFRIKKSLAIFSLL